MPASASLPKQTWRFRRRELPGQEFRCAIFDLFSKPPSVTRLLSLSRNRAIRQSRKPTPDRAKTGEEGSLDYFPQLFIADSLQRECRRGNSRQAQKDAQGGEQDAPFPGPVLLPGLSTLNTTRQNNHENVAPTKKRDSASRGEFAPQIRRHLLHRKQQRRHQSRLESTGEPNDPQQVAVIPVN